MDRKYQDLVNDLIENGDVSSAESALRKKMEEGDGGAFAIYGIYVFTRLFSDYEMGDAFDSWEKGAALGDPDCKGLLYLRHAELSLDPEAEVSTLRIDGLTADRILRFAPKSNGCLTEFLMTWLLEDGFCLELPPAQCFRLIILVIKYAANHNPYFLELHFPLMMEIFRDLDYSDKDFLRLKEALRPLLTEEHPLIGFYMALHTISFDPYLVDREELLRWISFIKDESPMHYHCLMSAYQDQGLAIEESAIHAEEAYRIDPSSPVGACIYAFNLIKGKGDRKDLEKAEHILIPFDSALALRIKAHCRMFIDPEHPDIERAIELLEDVTETDAIYVERLLYLLYAESKLSLPDALREYLSEEMKYLKEGDKPMYLFLRGVRLALREDAPLKEVADCLMSEKTYYHDLIPLWATGHLELDLSDINEDILHDERIDTETRYQLAFRFVLQRITKNDHDGVKEALSWVDSLGCKRYQVRNRSLRHLLWILGEPNLRIRRSAIDKFMQEWDELQEDGLANYVRVFIEATKPRINWNRLNHFVKRVEESRDGYSMVCVGHILMKKGNGASRQRGIQLEDTGFDLSALSRMDRLIEAVTGGALGDLFIG